MKRRLFVMMGALLAAGCVLAYAESATLDVDFPFEAGGKPFAAGKYTFELVSPNTISLDGPEGRVTLVVITRLALQVNDPNFKVAFDKIKNEFLLSEVWFPGKDGFLILSTAHAHDHHILGAEAHPPKT